MSTENTTESESAGGAYSRRAAVPLAALSGLLWVLVFPEVGWWWLTPLAPVPLLLVLEHTRRARDGLLLGFVFGLTFYCTVLHWMSLVHWTLPFVLGCFEAVHACGLALVLAWTLSRHRRWPRVLVVPVLWTACDAVRSFGTYGFPLFQPAQAMPADLPLVQSADLIGEIGLSFLLSAATGLLLDFRRAWRGEGGWGTPIVGAVLLAGILAGLSMYGRDRAQNLALTPGPGVLVVQANIAQDLKEDTLGGSLDPGARAVATRLERILDRHVILSMEQLSRAPDLVVWGETMYPQDLSDKRNAPHIQRVADLVERMEAAFLIGGFRFEPNPQDEEAPLIYNAAFYFEPKSAPAVWHLSDAGFKRHLVPGGEFTPFGSLPGVRALIAAVGGTMPDLARGRQPVHFELETRVGARVPFGVFICFETYFPELIADLVTPARGARFLINMSNEGWFQSSAELDLHVAAARLRAIEFRRSIVRATNTGVTCCICPDGSLAELLTDGAGQDREVEGVLSCRPPLCSELTVYLRFGQWYSRILLVLAAILVLAPGQKRAPAAPLPGK